jgi:hypothetical protein
VTPAVTQPPVRARRSPRAILLTYGLDWLAIFAFAAALIWPLFKIKYLDAWHSIESTFIADARFLADHWPHPNWQPNWYCGTRTDYIYPPALRYGTAVLAKYIPRVLPARAYHIYTAFFYCFGIAAIYLFVRWASGSRTAGGIAAIAVALISPTYLLVHANRDNTPFLMPFRLAVLIQYGEGPHMTALAWIPLALLFSFRSISAWRPASLAAAGVCCAMVVSNNFYGATALAMLYPILVWSIYITHLDKWAWVRAAAIPILAYGLCAFWLVPSYLQITLYNMRFVSTEGNMWSRWVALGVVIGFLLLSDYFARGRKQHAYLVFICGALAAFSVNTLGNRFLDFRIMGEPSRLYPELDLLFILAGVELLRRFWSAPWRWTMLRRALAGVVVVLALSPAWRYVKNAHHVFVRANNHEDRVEYQLQDWVAKNMPGSRAVTAGSVRFWYNAWNDLPQLGGGSEQGLLNPKVVPPQWEMTMGTGSDLPVQWMKLLGVEAVIVNEKHSREHYHDFVAPERFRGVLPVLHDNGAGDIIYGVPRRYKALARVVDRTKFDALPVIPGNGQAEELNAWLDVVENGPDSPTEMQWLGTDAFRVKARVGAGQSLWVPVSHDTNWRATSAGRRLPIQTDKMGFMIVDVPPGDHDILFEFPTPFVSKLGRAVTLGFLAVSVGLVWLGNRRRVRV